jgi:uncharacterized integral membrane protein
MPWRLIGLALIFVVFLSFIGLNLDNRVVISFGFWATKEPVPVFLPVFASFVLGLLCSIPFAISLSLRRSRKGKADAEGGVGRLSKKKRGKEAPPPGNAAGPGAFPTENSGASPYDID